MITEERQAIIDYHQARIARFGAGSSLALGWNTSETQYIRFKVLAGIADLSDCTVLDAGCGRGDLRPYLGERFDRLRYYGMEQIPAFLKIADKQYGHLPDTHFLAGDFINDPLPPADYVLASGSLNYKNNGADFIFNAITRLFGHCSKGLAFNLLSKTGHPEAELVAYDPALILAHCRRLSGHVIHHENYLEGDYTVFAFK